MFFWIKAARVTPEQREAQKKAVEKDMRFVVLPTILSNGDLGYEVREKFWLYGGCFYKPIFYASYTTKDAAQAACDHMNGVEK